MEVLLHNWHFSCSCFMSFLHIIFRFFFKRFLFEKGDILVQTCCFDLFWFLLKDVFFCTCVECLCRGTLNIILEVEEVRVWNDQGWRPFLDPARGTYDWAVATAGGVGGGCCLCSLVIFKWDTDLGYDDVRWNMPLFDKSFVSTMDNSNVVYIVELLIKL